MGLQIEISDSIVQALRLPEERIEEELRRELAIALYTQNILPFGKARELTQMDKYEFGQLLARRQVLRHYGFEELNDDLTYAGGELIPIVGWVARSATQPTSTFETSSD